MSCKILPTWNRTTYIRYVRFEKLLLNKEQLLSLLESLNKEAGRERIWDYRI